MSLHWQRMLFCLGVLFGQTLAAAAPQVVQVVINDGLSHRSRIDSIQVDFDQPVTAQGVCLVLCNSASGQCTTPSSTALAGTGTSRLLWDLTQMALPRGGYSGTILASSITGTGNQAMAQDYVFTFHCKPGDITGDNKVNVFDLQRMAISWNKQPAQQGYDPACDLTQDNRVNVFDLQLLAANWNT